MGGLNGPPLLFVAILDSAQIYAHLRNLRRPAQWHRPMDGNTASESNSTMTYDSGSVGADGRQWRELDDSAGVYLLKTKLNIAKYYA